MPSPAAPRGCSLGAAVKVSLRDLRGRAGTEESEWGGGGGGEGEAFYRAPKSKHECPH